MVTGKTWLHNNGLIVKQMRSLGVPLWDEVAEATVFLWSNFFCGIFRVQLNWDS